MRPERGLSTILHCLQWYKLVLRTRSSSPAVQHPVLSVCSSLNKCERSIGTSVVWEGGSALECEVEMVGGCHGDVVVR